MEGVFIGTIAASFILAVYLCLRRKQRGRRQQLQEATKPPGQLLDTMPVKGFAYVPQRDTVAQLLKNGEPIRLLLEPTNPHDCKAVRLLRADGRLIGYLPRRCNAIPGCLLEQGQPLVGRLRLENGEGRFRRMAVEIYWEVTK